MPFASLVEEPEPHESLVGGGVVALSLLLMNDILRHGSLPSRDAGDGTGLLAWSTCLLEVQ